MLELDWVSNMNECHDKGMGHKLVLFWATTTTLPLLQMWVEGFLIVFSATTGTTTPSVVGATPPSLQEWRGFLVLLWATLGTTTPSLTANTRGGDFSFCSWQLLAPPLPPSLQMQEGEISYFALGDYWHHHPPPSPQARERGILVSLSATTGTTPSLTTNARGGGGFLILFSGTTGTTYFVLSDYWHHHPLPCCKREWRGFLYVNLV